MTERDELPLPDYDHLPVGGLTSRIRTLDADGLQTVLDLRAAHANRVQVVTAMENRLSALKDGAQPSGGDPAAAAPDAPAAAAGGRRCPRRPSGPPVNPPSHGDPTNPSPAALTRTTC